MAEGNVNSLVIPEKSESGGSISSDNGCSILLNDQRVSYGSVGDVKNSRRYSTGKPSSENSNQKVVPHYLRASTGSCHDFCKYGRKQAFEEKERHPLRKSTTRAPSGKQNFAVTIAQGERKKSMAVKLTTSADIRSPSLEPKAASDAIQSPNPPEIIKREVLTSKKFEVTSKQDLSTDEKMLKTEKRMNTSSEKLSPSVQSQLMKQSTKKMNTFSEKRSPSLQPQLMKQSKKKMNTTSEKRSPSAQPRLIEQSSSYPPESGKKMRPFEKGMKISSSRLQPVTGKSSPYSQVPGGINGRGRRKDYIKTSKNIVVSKSPAKKTLVPQTSSSPMRPSVGRTMSLKAEKNRSSKLMSSPKSQNRVLKTEMEETNTEKVPEKTLHVVETETQNSLSEPSEDSNVIPSFPSQSHQLPDSLSQPHSSSLSSHEDKEEEEEEEEEEGEEEEKEIAEEEEEGNGYSCDKAGDFISENNSTANSNGIKAVGGNRRKILRKGTVLSESKDSTAVKLKFRRGKVVDIQSENNGARRLRFRRARVMEENHDSKYEIRRKNFKKKGDDGGGNGTNPSDKKVVLRHQDTQGKRDAQGLFNNVIEETASKLVESRKSKVKALVGAFETVISLQDSKPSAQAVA